MNASDDRGIDVVREQIKNFAETRTLFSKGYKLIILDEADMMTTAAQAALRRVIEQYTKNVRFCIICNYVNKIVPAIQSRCTRFRFSPLPIPEVQRRVDGVIEAEGYVTSTAPFLLSLVSPSLALSRTLPRIAERISQYARVPKSFAT